MSFDPEKELGKLHELILTDMRAASNSDMAADGPVGNEEDGVWARIEALAREQREHMAGLQSRLGPAEFASPLVVSKHACASPDTFEWRLTLSGQTVNFAFFGKDTTSIEAIRQLLGSPWSMKEQTE